MKFMSRIKHIIFGVKAKGENIMERQPYFTTYHPDTSLDFNSWAGHMKVGSRVSKNDLINPWYKERHSRINKTTDV